MKASCRALYLSIFISSIFLVLIIIFAILVLIYECKLLEILLNIFIGIFGSGCVTLLMAIPAYNVSKQKLLEKYWQEANRLIGQFHNIHFLFNEYSDEAVIFYINELKNRKWKEEYNKISKEKLDLENKKYKNILIREFINNNLNCRQKVNKKWFRKYANKCIDDYIKGIRIELKKICKQYIKVSKENVVELNSMLGDMQFFSGKKPFIKIYNNTYKPLYDILNEIQKECYHFQIFLNGQGNEAITLKKLLILQRKIFDLEIEETENYKKYIINNQFSNKMLINLETLRADIYGIEPQYPNLYPQYYRIYHKNAN